MQWFAQGLTSSRAEGRFSVGLICSRRSACTITVGREAYPCFGGTGARRLRVLVDGLAYPLDKGGACGAELAAGDDQFGVKRFVQACE